MKSLTNTTELRQFLGMVNQLGKFSAHLVEQSQPLLELLSHKKAWLWGPAQEAYASCAMTPTEQRYLQIEKEALALVCA